MIFWDKAYDNLGHFDFITNLSLFLLSIKSIVCAVLLYLRNIFDVFCYLLKTSLHLCS